MTGKAKRRGGSKPRGAAARTERLDIAGLQLRVEPADADSVRKEAGDRGVSVTEYMLTAAAVYKIVLERAEASETGAADWLIAAIRSLEGD